MKKPYRKTKCFSVLPSDIRWFEKLAVEADKNGRTESGQLVLVLQNHFEQQDIIRKINSPITLGSAQTTPVNPDQFRTTIN